MTVETVTSAILKKMRGIGKCQQRFLVCIVYLLLQMRGRVNFTNMSRYSPQCEQHFRKWFSKPFDFATFNRHLVCEHGGTELIIAFDPSYLPKSGKQTPGVGYFWSGCAQSVKWGMEMSSLSIIDLSNRTAFHYEALQTLHDKAKQSLREYYADEIVKRKEELQKMSQIMVFDAFFSKKEFVDRICGAGFTMISRLQHNIYLRYRYQGPEKGGRGARQKYDGQIDPKNVSTEHFKKISHTEEEVVYEGLAHVRALERWVKLIIVQPIKDGKMGKPLLYFSTTVGDLNIKVKAKPKPNPKVKPKTQTESQTESQTEPPNNTPLAPEVSGEQISRYYPARFLMEFGFRDGKQHLGLTHCQSRQKEAIKFHLNIILTTLNIAKIVHWMPTQKQDETPFSIADIKTMYSNELLLDQLILTYGKDPQVEKNNPLIKKLYDLGRMAA
jgi:hypothetical protein